MKGMEMLASLVAILFLIGIGSLIGGIVILVINLIHLPTTQPINYELYIFSSYPAIKYQTMMLSYLEATDENGIQIKKILTYGVYQDNLDDVFVDGTEVTTLGASTSEMFKKWIPNEFYVLSLSINGEGHVIAKNFNPSGSDDTLKTRMVSVPVYIDRSNFMLYSSAKNKDIPLKVTLDLYV
jgi:hypothetical protein